MIGGRSSGKLVWVLFAAVLVMLPLVPGRGYGLSLLCQMGIMVVFALSYNVLLGQTGLLSFGHAAYYGLGAMFTLHTLNAVSAGLPIPVTLLPLVGGLAGMAVGLVLGYVTTRKAGTTFSMISLGIGEMVAASSLMFPAFFGGEGGVSGNRVVGKAVLGITYGPQVEMYYLIAGWTFLSVLAMYALTQTPLGRMANAVRDNAERAEFVGYNPRRVRYMMLVLAGFFAGVSGGLAALNYEIVTAESLSSHTSGMVLLATFVGGVGLFFGPVIGAVVVTLMATALSAVTKAWPFYFGLMFLGMVLYAPGGLASWVVLHKRLWDTRQIGRAARVYVRLAVPTVLAFVTTVTLVEMGYFASDSGGGVMTVFGVTLDTHSAVSWCGVLAAVGATGWLWHWQWQRVAGLWNETMTVVHGGGRP